MPRNLPLTIRKLVEINNSKGIINNHKEEYLIQFNEKQNNWNLSKIFDRQDLITLRNDINIILGLKSAAEKLKCTIEEAEKISEFHKQNKICDNCKFKLIECISCIYICQSPLEQSLFLALRDENIKADLQMRINKNGILNHHSISIDKTNILTIPDFYIESNEKRICIYADGHTYHERTEYQALRDRNIDRELQNLGFIVLRFTGKEIREKIEIVIETIKKNI